MIQAQGLRAFEPWRGLLMQAGRFLVTGGLATLCHWLLLLILVEAFLLKAVVATSLGYAGAAALNYWLRRRFVFRSQAPHHHVLPRYLLVLVAGFGLNAGIMAVGAGSLGLPYLTVQIVATGIVTAWNFAAHRAWSFRGASAIPRVASRLHAQAQSAEMLRQGTTMVYRMATRRSRRLAEAVAARQRRQTRSHGLGILPARRAAVSGRSDAAKLTSGH